MGSTSSESDARRLFEYFIVAGLRDSTQDLVPLVHEGSSVSEPVAPITDICVIFPGLGETVPEGYEIIETTPMGHVANLNHGSLRSHSAFLCFRRGYHKPALMDLGILDDGRGEKPMTDATIIDRTPFGRSANVNNTSHGLYFTTRRSQPYGSPHKLVITHICVILTNKGEIPPHTYYKIGKNLNKGMVGSDVYVCYKKSQLSSKRIAYKPDVLDCYPKVENIDESLAKNVPMFCLPMGALIEIWSDKCSDSAEKLFSTCVLTDEKGTKYYGASLTFYETYTKELTGAQLEILESSNFVNFVDDSKNAQQEEQKSVNGVNEEDVDIKEKVNYYCNKSICVVSRYPFFESFRRFLFFVYGISISGPHKIPIERYISHLMYEVPFPSPTRPRVLVQLGSDMVAFESHDDSQIPLSGATFVDALKNLGSENFMYAMLLALLEQKILLHSLRPWLLTSVSETICALMFPFHWQCPYIPQCPLALAGVLHAPLPFIAGVDSKYFDFYEEPPADVTCFDLDTATVSQSEIRKYLKLAMLPKKPLKRLRTSLETISKQMTEDVKMSRKNSDIYTTDLEQQMHVRKACWDIAIREAFLRFMCSLMTGYANHLRPIMKTPREVNATDTGALFNLDSFLQSRDKNSQDFYKRFSETQCFIRFIEERSFVSDKNAYNVFFDDCILKLAYEKATRIDVRLLDNDALTANHTIVVNPPEIMTLQDSEKRYRYDRFPANFDHSLFETDLILKAKQKDIFNATSKNSPMKLETIKYWAIRTKHESRTSIAEAAKFPEERSKTMLFYAYSLWFLQLPSLIAVARNKTKILRLAFKILSRMERSNIQLYDQICYRILMYLCGEYNQPAMAIQVLRKMQRMGISLNAVTYGIYHHSLMQGEWPTDERLKAIDAWTRLRIRIEVCSLFRDSAKYSKGSLGNTNNTSTTTPQNGTLENTGNTEGESPEMDSPLPSLQAMNLTNSINSLSNSDKLDMKSEDGKSTENLYEVTVLPLDDPKESDEKIQVPVEPGTTTKPDPLGVGSVKMDSSERIYMSSLLSPSRQRFIKEHSATPFSDELSNGLEKEEETKKKSFKLGSSWFKGLTNSPIVSKLMGNQFSDSLNDLSRNESLRSSENNLSTISISPSLSSIVHQFRKQAQKGYDEVVMQGNVLLKRSGINSLVNEAKNLNRSYSKDISGISTFNSSDDNVNLYKNMCQSSEFADPAFQLDSGQSGDILGAEFWMREILPQNITDIKNMWIKETDNSFIDITLSSCSLCSNCNSIIYDEEIIAGWSIDDSNLNTGCVYCNQAFLPLLKVSIMKQRNELNSSWYIPLSININSCLKNDYVQDGSEEDRTIEKFSVPFISPLVLRKELETLLIPDCLALAQVSLRVTHPVIFWNLLYYFRRLDLPSHILTWIAPHVHIRCVYDVPALHSENEAPIYFANHPVYIF